MWDAFEAEYLPLTPKYVLASHEIRSESASGRTLITAQINVDGTRRTITGEGNGPIDAFVTAMSNEFKIALDVKDYSEHALGQGSEATAVAYVETTNGDGTTRWGVGVDPNTITASLRALLNAHERHDR